MQQFIQRFIPYLIAVFLFFYCWNVYWGGQRSKGFFLSDSNGYYAYLPATFIYRDFNFSFTDSIQKKYYSTFGNFDFRQQQKSSAKNKWYCGTAVAIAPFFFLSHALCKLEGGEADGYSYRYAWGLNMASIFYCLIGLLVLRKILRRFIKSENLIALVMVFIVFGTNLFYYATSEPAMSHVYSFAFINLFVLVMMKFIESGNGKYLLISGLIFGMILIIRPVNGLIVFIVPLLTGSREKFIHTFRLFAGEWKRFILSIILVSSVVFIQLYYYWLQTGNWFIYSYGDEKMDLFKPHLVDFLISYKKGLFVYLPLILISLTGFVFLYKKNRWQFYSLLVFTASLWYIFSSWWNWWYGGSFATRPIIDYLFIFSILLGITIESLVPVTKKIMIGASILCVVVCQVQTYQYRYYFIHWDKMDKEHYWNVFMRIDLIVKKENPNAGLVSD